MWLTRSILWMNMKILQIGSSMSLIMYSLDAERFWIDYIENMSDDLEIESILKTLNFL